MLLQIARMGRPVLRQRAEEVKDPKSPEIQRLIDDMIATLQDSGGVGLAAPQVHMPLRIIVIGISENRANGLPSSEDGTVGPLAIINPTIEILDDGEVMGFEGCLSVPGLRGVVPRAKRIRYQGLDRTGAPLSIIASGFHARVVQHEVDHLDGILYLERIRDMKMLALTEEVPHLLESLHDQDDEDC